MTINTGILGGDPKKAKKIILAIIDAAGKTFTGKTRLYKAFYAAHLFHFNNQPGLLSQHRIVHMPRGPAIDEGDILIESLVKEGRITVLKKMDGPYPEYMFTIVGEADAIDDGEMQSVREAVAWIGNRTAKELSDITHRASWDETDNGEEMNIYADLIDPEEYDAIKQRQQAIKRELDGIQSAEQC